MERASIGAEVRFLTSAFPNGGQGISPIKEVDAFTEFRRIAKATANNRLATSPNIGSSFLILDDCLILSSTPFRSDVFVYLDQVRIQGFYRSRDRGVYWYF